jgi:hypothetical protein
MRSVTEPPANKRVLATSPYSLLKVLIANTGYAILDISRAGAHHMNAQPFVKGQQVKWVTGVTKMVDGKLTLTNARTAHGVVVGFFKANAYIRVRENGAAKSDTSLMSARELTEAN